jgi:hypothetical protein
VNYQIYILSNFQQRGFSSYFHQNMPGFNGLFNSTPGYNYVIGNGTPIGTSFILTPNLPAAGTPQTPSNP